MTGREMAGAEVVGRVMSVPTPPVVEFRNVTKTYHAGTAKAFTAIRDVTFKVEDRADHVTSGQRVQQMLSVDLVTIELRRPLCGRLQDLVRVLGQPVGQRSPAPGAAPGPCRAGGFPLVLFAAFFGVAGATERMRKATREEIVGEEAIEQTVAFSEQRFEWRARSSLLACQAPVVDVAQV